MLGVQTLALLVVFSTLHCARAWLGGGVNQHPFWTTAASAISDGNNNSNSEAERLSKQASELRKEIDRYEKQKESTKQKQKEMLQEEVSRMQAERERYSTVVPILKPDGSTVNERCDFAPKHKEGSYITTFTASLPLGIVLGESDEYAGTTAVVDEVGADGNGYAAGLRVGDIVRAVTACRMELEQPTWQLIAGGIGVPKTKRFMYSVDNRPFEEVLDAIASNRMDPDERPVLLVVERLSQ